MRCARCKVMLYCSREHQKWDYENHKPACSAVAHSKMHLDDEEQKLRSEPGDDFSMPPNPFETAVGLFWGILGTRDYMRARFAYIDSMKDIYTFDSVQIQLEHAQDMIRLCWSDNMGIRDYVPPLLLRLDRDQECYDFIKWWCTEEARDNREWLDTGVGHLDIQGANAFEPVTDLLGKYSDLGLINALALLKTRLLLDLQALQNSAGIPSLQELPREIFDAIRSHMPRSSIVRQDRALRERQSFTADIRELESQVHHLYAYIHDANHHFWSVLLYPGSLLEKEERPGYYSMGTIEDAQYKLGCSYDAWFETPGAIAVIKAKYDADPSS
jgi:hypothetical protein